MRLVFLPESLTSEVHQNVFPEILEYVPLSTGNVTWDISMSLLVKYMKIGGMAEASFIYDLLDFQT